MSVLPSLNALRAFEATARHKSISLAAAELNVTHGAVSRQVKALEATLAQPLIVRKVRSIDVTPEGIILAEGVAAAFKTIHTTLEDMRPGPLSLSCSPSMAMCWLVPRMSLFYERHPGIEIKLDMNYDRIDFGRDNTSIAIRNSTIEPKRNIIIRDLGVEWIGLVCSPELAQSLDIRNLSDIPKTRLLTTQTRPTAWREWLDSSDAEGAHLPPQTEFAHFYLMLQAASSGLGLAVAPYMLALHDLSLGRLVAPFGFVPGPRKTNLWIAPQAQDRRDVRALERWIISEMTLHSEPDNKPAD
ncbi:LysR substrate-binding domain-containing protein [Mesorhizobium retamae]|uniref:LysR substrate-binding domain-containing protein n=1 Tax=Mesorhizobium retamae TaxID=2912854 RepID=A0ABS9QD90_9HYPH|nr:LysR substrate-binding domain-containing protein [Mesorhizobium sp. IRAMC:0171]MCG7505376.1 LysR substrate-binding domain-containing protein [Mesorhizobium sp. IRAMC:0171]